MKTLISVAVMTSLTFFIPSVYAQQSFESEEHGYRLHIPQGWVIQDEVDITGDTNPNLDIIALLCKENEALPDVGGDYDCQYGELTDRINLNKFIDLQSIPELQNDNSNNTITTNDLVALEI
jgi:hypothetical protein